ncbi:hypothetical protein QT327_16855 [Olivibacter sp. 47]|uniref:hypothetical protein n=1 Tax=Olivibacter sp. 47 TaxID=3056486 RepID=UPI0025A412F3|nr:hypothetical protein [Olivibacter sp. 47]MDM8175998.1 hypothetical protein [Olivibacter sp. 47]
MNGKSIMLTATLGLLSSWGCAQTFSEWFSQKKTQKKYLVQQIAAFEAYKGVLAKGYEIARTGLNTFWDIRNGEFNLHNDVFNRLLGLNPKIRDYARISEIISMQVEILGMRRKCLGNVSASGIFNEQEMNYVSSVFTKLTEDCAELIDELADLSSASGLSMSDDERLKRLDELYLRMQENKQFSAYFSTETGLLVAARTKELKSVEKVKELYKTTNEE